MRLSLAAVILLAVLLPAAALAQQQQRRAGDFDFYVLALSWSPSYCAAEGEGANRQQCGSGRAHGFVVHGLWPQYERGFPRECRTERRRVPERIVRTMLDIMPSGGLVGHQWRMHGTCSGLSQQDYFDTVRAAREKVVIPQRFEGLAQEQQIAASVVEAAFMRANPGLPEDGVSVSCEGRFMREVRICLTRDLQFRACGELERRACSAAGLRMPPIR